MFFFKKKIQEVTYNKMSCPYLCCVVLIEPKHVTFFYMASL